MEENGQNAKRVLVDKSRMRRKRALAYFQEYSANISKANEYERQWRQIDVRKILEKKDVGKCDEGKTRGGLKGRGPSKELWTPVGPCF